MGKKRKSGDSEVQDGAPGKRKTSIAAAKLSHSSKAGVALPANNAVKKSGKKGGGSGNEEKGGTNCSETLSVQRSKGSAIDAMFGALKSAKKRAEPVVATETQPGDELDTQPGPKQPKKKGSKDDIFGAGIKSGRRYDEEGLPVYSPEELGLGKGGDTAACPFDCECCL